VSGGRLKHRTVATGFPLLLTAMMTGCAAPRTIVVDESERQVSVGEAFVSLGPSAPPVLSIVEHSYQNATRQTFRLATRGATPGENTLRVDVIGIENSSISRDAILPDASLEASQLSSEADDALPGVPLRTSLTYLQNRSGPFGYAVGQSTQGDECIYAWQRIATPDRDLNVFNSRNTLSIRLRLCEPHTSEAALIGSMMGLNVNVDLSGGLWAPEPRKFSSEIGSPGTAIGPPQILAAASSEIEQTSRPPGWSADKRKRNATLQAPTNVPTQNPLIDSAVIVPPPPAGLMTPAAEGPAIPVPEGVGTARAKL
jgi:Cellulose biosynthesis protein BcsN